MCQSVFDHGSLVAFHANERTAEGRERRGQPQTEHLRPRRPPFLRGTRLGPPMARGPLGRCDPQRARTAVHRHQSAAGRTAERIRLRRRPCRLDARTGHRRPLRRPTRRPDRVFATHQLLLAVLGAAQHGRGRRGSRRAASRGPKTDDYRDSTEELHPLAGDPARSFPWPWPPPPPCQAGSWSWFASGSVSNYALTAQGWQQILKRRPPDPSGPVQHRLDGASHRSSARTPEPHRRPDGGPARLESTRLPTTTACSRIPWPVTSSRPPWRAALAAFASAPVSTA